MTHERRWHVLFFRFKPHWTMRWVARRHPGYGHAMLLSPIGGGRWLGFEWSFAGILMRPVGETEAARLMELATEVLEYDQRGMAANSFLHALLPNTCMTMIRQATGLPARLNFFRSGWQLRGELLAAGGRVVVPARRNP